MHRVYAVHNIRTNGPAVAFRNGNHAIAPMMLRALSAQALACAGAAHYWPCGVAWAALAEATVAGGHDANTGSAPLGSGDCWAGSASEVVGAAMGGRGEDGEELRGEPRRVGALDSGREELASLKRSHSSAM